MALRQNIEQARTAQVAQILANMRAAIEGFFVLGMNALDHPVSGLADTFAEWHSTIEKAEAAHAEHMAPKLAPEGKTLEFKP